MIVTVASLPDIDERGGSHAIGPEFISADVLDGARPPTVADFQDDALAMTMDVRAILHAVRITIERLFVPRLI